MFKTITKIMVSTKKKINFSITSYRYVIQFNQTNTNYLERLEPTVLDKPQCRAFIHVPMQGD